MPKVTLSHPDLKETITVSEHSVPIHEAAGWKVADKAKNTPKSTPEPES